MELVPHLRILRDAKQASAPAKIAVKPGGANAYLSYCPTLLLHRKAPCSLYTPSTQLPSGLAQPMSEEKASPQGVSMWLWSWGGPRCFPPGKEWSHPTPGTKMSHYSFGNNIWYTTHIWHDFPSYAAGLGQIKSVELQWRKAGISKVRIRPLSVLYSLIIWEAEHFLLSA